MSSKELSGHLIVSHVICFKSKIYNNFQRSERALKSYKYQNCMEPTSSEVCHRELTDCFWRPTAVLLKSLCPASKFSIHLDCLSSEQDLSLCFVAVQICSLLPSHATFFGRCGLIAEQKPIAEAASKQQAYRHDNIISWQGSCRGRLGLLLCPEGSNERCVVRKMSHTLQSLLAATDAGCACQAISHPAFVVVSNDTRKP